MGFIRVVTRGSFPERDVQFGATSHGHAYAVAQMIQFLSEVVLPAAIAQDHKLHDEGKKPARGFDYRENNNG